MSKNKKYRSQMVKKRQSTRTAHIKKTLPLLSRELQASTFAVTFEQVKAYGRNDFTFYLNLEVRQTQISRIQVLVQRVKSLNKFSGFQYLVY